MDAEGGDLAAQLLDVAVLAVQRHLELQARLALVRDHLSPHPRERWGGGGRCF